MTLKQAFLTDEFRIFTDHYAINIVSIEAVGDDGFYVKGPIHTADHIWSDVSMVVDDPLTIIGIIPSRNTGHVGLIGFI